MEEIEKRFQIGYTLSIYGNREILYKQMINDIETLLKQNQALQLQQTGVSGQLPNNLILYRNAKKLNYSEFCKWINAKLGNLR